MYKTSKIPYVLVAILAVMLTACEKDINLPLPQSKTKLVINCGANPDSTWKVYVGQTIPLFDKASTPKEIDNAEVTIKSEDGEIRLKPEGNGIYTSPLKPTIGKKYTIEAKATGLTTATASCTIPSLPSLENTTVLRTESSYKKIYNISVTIDDPSETEDYYIIEVRDVVEDKSRLYPWYEYHNLYTKDIFCENVSEDESNRQLLFKDISFNGEKRKIQFYFETINEYNDRTECIVKRCSKDFWEYKRTLFLYDENVDSPFTQPVQIHTNVSNGVGIFGAYTSTIQIIRTNQNPI